MSIIEPSIDGLLEKTDGDRFLLCSLSSKRAKDINDMMRAQRDRARARSCGKEVAESFDKKSMSIAFEEIADGEVSFDPQSIDVKQH
ncbi:MAG: DNA-directed RNA polymerase subunit omega [Eggerthellaceae bacterium]|nr:DNA-directed RNA polymerase subunit omega [Eggerthellaceae bacterium]